MLVGRSNREREMKEVTVILRIFWSKQGENGDIDEERWILMVRVLE